MAQNVEGYYTRFKWWTCVKTCNSQRNSVDACTSIFLIAVFCIEEIVWEEIQLEKSEKSGYSMWRERNKHFPVHP